MTAWQWTLLYLAVGVAVMAATWRHAEARFWESMHRDREEDARELSDETALSDRQAWRVAGAIAVTSHLAGLLTAAAVWPVWLALDVRRWFQRRGVR